MVDDKLRILQAIKDTWKDRVTTVARDKQPEMRFASLLPGDDVTDAVVDPFDNVLATGFGPNAQFNNDIFTVKLK